MAAAGLCHSDEHLVTGDMVVPDEIRAQCGPARARSRSSVATRVPASCVEVGPGVTSVQPGDHVSASFIPSLRPLPLLLDRPPEPLRPRRLLVPRGPDHRRHLPPLLRRARAQPHGQARHVQRAHRGRGSVGDQGRRPISRSTVVALVCCGVATGGASAVAASRHPARRHRRRRGHRRHRHQRRPGSADGRGAARHRRRPHRVQAREGHGAGRHPHLRVAWSEAIPAVHGDDLGPDGRPGDHDARRAVRRADGRRQRAVRQGRHDASSPASRRSPRPRPASTCSSSPCGRRRSRARSSAPSTRVPTSRSCSTSTVRASSSSTSSITRTYPLDEINEGYQDMRDGTNIRGVIVFD